MSGPSRLVLWGACALFPAAAVAAEPLAPAAPAVPPAFLPGSLAREASGVFVWRSDFQAVRAEASGFLAARVEGARGHALGFRFDGETPVGEAPGSTRHRALYGADPAAWIVDERAYGRIRWRDVVPGADVVLLVRDGALAWDLELRELGALRSFELTIEGADLLRVDADGALVAQTPLGEWRMSAPVTTILTEDGGRRAAASRFVLDGARHLLRIDADFPADAVAAVVDPTLVWTSAAGGAGVDRSHAIALDVNDEILVCGSTDSSTLPATAGAFDATYNGGQDAFVARFPAAGGVPSWITYLGGGADDVAMDVAVEPQSGDAVVAGWTESALFPTTPGAFDGSHNGGRDLFVARVTADGTSLRYSTFLGGSGDEALTHPLAKDVDRFGIALDGSGACTLGSWSSSEDWPVTPGAFQSALAGPAGGDPDMVIARLAPDGGSLLWSTYAGGGMLDAATAVAVRGDGTTYVAGFTRSLDFPIDASSPVPLTPFAGDGIILRIPASGIGADFAWAAPGVSYTGFGSNGGWSPRSRAAEFGATGELHVAYTANTVVQPNGGVFGRIVHLDPSTDTWIETSLTWDAHAMAPLSDGSMMIAGSNGGTTIGSPYGQLWRIPALGTVAGYDFVQVHKGFRFRDLAVASGDRIVTLSDSSPATFAASFEDINVASWTPCAGSFTNLGGGCTGGVSGKPALLSGKFGCPAGNAPLQLVTANVSPTATAGFLLVGTGPGNLALSPSCSLSIGSLLPVLVPMSDSPSPSVQADIPPLPSALLLFVQAVLLDPAAADGYAVSTALAIQFAP